MYTFGGALIRPVIIRDIAHVSERPLVPEPPGTEVVPAAHDAAALVDHLTAILEAFLCS